MNYRVRKARIEDGEMIYLLKSQNLRPYVEKIWGWDEDFQRERFKEGFEKTDNFQIVEVEGKFAGFFELETHGEVISINNIHLVPEYRGRGIGSAIIRDILSNKSVERTRVRCFRTNAGARELYLRMGFTLVSESETHFLFEKEKGNED